MILHGHVVDRLRTLAADSIQTVITSPPYWGLRSYGTEPQVWGDAWRGELGLEPTPELFVQHIVEVFCEVKRVLRPDGTLWLNFGDSYAGSMKGKGGVVRSDKQLSNKGSFTEPVEIPVCLKPKDLCGIPWRVAFALQADGWWLRSDIIWAKPNPMPESVTDRPTRSHEYIFLLTKSPRYFYDQEGVREPAQDWGLRDRSKSKYSNPNDGSKPDRVLTNCNCAESGRNLRSVWTFSTQSYRDAHFATFPEELVKRCILAGTAAQACEVCGAAWVRVVKITQHKISDSPITGIGDDRRNPDGRTDLPKQRTRKEVETLGFRPSCGCQGNGTGKCAVLDPFLGSGTVGKVATELGREWIGIELKPNYVRMAQRRTITTRGML